MFWFALPTTESKINEFGIQANLAIMNLAIVKTWLY